MFEIVWLVTIKGQADTFYALGQIPGIHRGRDDSVYVIEVIAAGFSQAYCAEICSALCSGSGHKSTRALTDNADMVIKVFLINGTCYATR